MSVRPFYISADIEGRKTELTGGPRRKDGYMNIEITQRDEGAITTAFTIRCYLETNKEIVGGKLLSYVLLFMTVTVI